MPEVSHRNSLQPGYMLNWYRIDKILGQGGFGITYLAYNANLDRMAAIKEYLPIELAVREGDCSVHPLTNEHGKQFHLGLDRFLSEAKTLARFEHPNIVRVFDIFESNHTAYMVMSYEEGESLQDVLTRRKTLGEEELMAILNPILDGLEKVHETGFIHRDIKPANIFLRKKDNSPVLLDFGSARQALGVLTKTLTTLVSPGYAPFEQYYSKSDAQGPWTDIYGLGATLYRAITGLPPMDAMDRSHMILKGGRNTFVPALEIGRGKYSDRFLQAVDHAMQFKEKDRPQTIADWRKEFVHLKKPVAVAKPAKVILESHQVTKEERIITFEPKPIPPPEKQATEPAPAIVLEQRPQTKIKPALNERPYGTRIVLEQRPQTKERRETSYSEPSQWRLSPRSAILILAPLLLIVVIELGWNYRGELGNLVLKRVQPEQSQQAQKPALIEAERAQDTEQERNVNIQSLLSDAKADFEALRLTQPKNDNALQGYRKVLELDPRNAEAKQGLSNIADKLVALAQHATAANEFTQAESYLNEAAAIVPDASNISLARNELNLRKAAQERADAEVKAKQEKALAVLKEAEAAADADDALAVLIKLEQARTLGADATAITTVKNKLHTRLETLAAAATEEAQQALKAKDTAKAREALKRAKDLKTQADALAAP